MPKETPDWGIKLLKILQGTIQSEIRSVKSIIEGVDTVTSTNTKSIKKIEKKLLKAEERNQSLASENQELKEKLLDLEFRQHCNNLIFEGIIDTPNETDIQCIEKLCYVIRNVPGLDVTNFRIDCCHRLDGKFKEGTKRRVICCFNWYFDVQCILKGRKRLPRGVFVTEDLPEEWNDRRKILKPIFNAAKRKETLKGKTRLMKDKLIIDGKPITIAPVNNISEANVFLDVTSTCQKSDGEKIIFFGAHSPFSNLYSTEFVIDNIHYNSVEQYYQGSKAEMFNDDITHSKIMHASNPYKIKKLGSKVAGFVENTWQKKEKDILFRGVHAKFIQNATLGSILRDSGDTKIAEASTNTTWGTGVHLHDKHALDVRMWKNKKGGGMSSILSRVRTELQA